MGFLNKKVFLLFIISSFLTCSCGDKFQPKKEIRTDCVIGSEPVRKVLFVGWDGVRTDALFAAHTPCIDSLLNHSYYNWSTDRGEYTVSVPGWSTILHGVWPSKHGLTDNTFSSNNYESCTDIFTLAKQLKPNLSVATLSNWDDFLRITEMENYAQHFDSDRDVKDDAIRLLNSCTPDIMVLHFDNPDAFGHDSGFSPTNQAYLDAISISDAYLSEIMMTIEQRESLYNEEWLIVISTDHGGEGTGHGNQYDLPQTRFVWSILRKPGMNGPIEIPMVNSVDLLPTMLNWLNIPLQSNWNLDGVILF
jgi:predicted AlkP superfamily pyrophosphatase or phosphodiesterase